MASTRTTFTMDSDLAERARRLDINISAAAREGVEAAVRVALAEADVQRTNSTVSNQIQSGTQTRHGPMNSPW
jgi:post-segregation antitoxin (ccd killing protein)